MHKLWVWQSCDDMNSAFQFLFWDEMHKNDLFSHAK